MRPRFDSADETTGWVLRTDRGELSPPKMRADGMLVVEGVLAREGVLVYRRNGREYREFVSEDVLKADAENMRSATVTVEHPREGGRLVLVTPRNHKRYGVGNVEHVEVVDGEMRARMVIRDDAGIKAIHTDKKHELSAGYLAKLDHTPGSHPTHGPYDARQVRRTGNHAAITRHGRAGGTVLRADSFDVELTPPPVKETRMNPLIATLLALAGLDLRADATDDEALKALATDAKDKKKVEDQLRADAADALKTAEAERDAAKGELETVAKERDQLRADAAEAADKAALVELKPVLEHFELKADSLGDARKAIAKAHAGTAYNPEAGDAYDAALVDLAKASIEARGDAAETWRKANDKPPVKRADDDGDTKRPSMTETSFNQFKNAHGGDQ